MCVILFQYKPASHHKGPYEFDKVRLRQDLSGPHLVRKLFIAPRSDVTVRLYIFIYIPGSCVGDGILYMRATAGKRSVQWSLIIKNRSFRIQ